MPFIAFDIETTGLNFYSDAKILNWTTCDEKGNCRIYRPFRPEILQDFINDTSSEKVTHNLKFGLHFLKKHQIKIHNEIVFHDTMIIHQFLNNLSSSHSLDDITLKLNINQKAEKCMIIFLTLYSDIKNNPLFLENYRNEIELIKVTVEIENKGILIDIEKAKKLIKFLEDEIPKIPNQIYKLTGENLNLSSSQQLSSLLFEKLKIKPVKNNKTGASTDKEVLNRLQKSLKDKNLEIVNLILKYRSYSGALLSIQNYISYSQNGIIHPNIHTNKTKTGRESSSNPPLQSVSRNQNLFNEYHIPLRSLFRVRPDTILFLPDYSGIEMRLLVNVSYDKEMMRIFKKGLNPHEIVAILFYGDQFTSKDKTPHLYNAAKNANFAIAYGAGSDKVAKILHLEKEKVRKSYIEYSKRFPKITNLSKHTMLQAERQGYINTLLGRKLFIPPDSYYSAINYIIQGTGAQILKIAQIRLHKYFQNAFESEVSILLPIHDELVIEYPRKYLYRQKEFIKQVSFLMTDFPQFEIPLQVEWKITTTTWDMARKI